MLTAIYPPVLIKEQNRWCPGYHYVDAYAGSGRPKLRDEELYIDGWRQAQDSMTRSNETVDLRLREAYSWLLVPAQEAGGARAG